MSTDLSVENWVIHFLFLMFDNGLVGVIIL